MTPAERLSPEMGKETELSRPQSISFLLGRLYQAAVSSPADERFLRNGDSIFFISQSVKPDGTTFIDIQGYEMQWGIPRFPKRTIKLDSSGAARVKDKYDGYRKLTDDQPDKVQVKRDVKALYTLITMLTSADEIQMDRDVFYAHANQARKFELEPVV